MFSGVFALVSGMRFFGVEKYKMTTCSYCFCCLELVKIYNSIRFISLRANWSLVDFFRNFLKEFTWLVWIEIRYFFLWLLDCYEWTWLRLIYMIFRILNTISSICKRCSLGLRSTLKKSFVHLYFISPSFTGLWKSKIAKIRCTI